MFFYVCWYAGRISKRLALWFTVDKTSSPILELLNFTREEKREVVDKDLDFKSRVISL